MASSYNFKGVSVLIGRKRFIIPPIFMAFDASDSFADVLAHAGSQSGIELPLEQHMAVIGLFTKSHGDIVPGKSGQIVMNGWGIIAIDFMLNVDAVHVKFDFPDERRVAPLDDRPDVFASMMAQAGANDLLPPVRSRHSRSDDLYNDLRAACNAVGLGWSIASVATTGKRFLDTLTSVLFYLDQHRAYFIERGRALPNPSMAHTFLRSPTRAKR